MPIHCSRSLSLYLARSLARSLSPPLSVSAALSPLRSARYNVFFFSCSRGAQRFPHGCTVPRPAASPAAAGLIPGELIDPLTGCGAFVLLYCVCAGLVRGSLSAVFRPLVHRSHHAGDQTTAAASQRGAEGRSARGGVGVEGGGGWSGWGGINKLINKGCK